METGFISPWTGTSDPGTLTPIIPTKDLTVSDVSLPSLASRLNAAANGGGGGFFSNLWNGVANSQVGQGLAQMTSYPLKALETIGTAVGDPIKSLVTGQPVNTVSDISNIWNRSGSQTWGDIGDLYSRSKGALQGAMSGAYSGIPSMLQSIGNGGLLGSIGNDAVSIGKGISQGWENPTAENQSFQQGLNTVTNPLPKSISWAPRFAAEAVTDPLTYAPVGLAGKAIKAGSDLVGATPYITSALDALKATKPVSAVTDAMGTLFKKYYGASPELVDTLRSGTAAQAGNQYNILNTIRDMSKSSGLSEAELNDIGHIIEGTKPFTSPEQQNLALKIRDLLRYGPPNTNIGTSALTHTPSAVTGDPLLPTARLNYFPHQYNNMPDELKGVFPKNSQGVPGLSNQGSYNLERTFNTLADAEAQGLKPELNPFNVTANHLNQTSKALTNNDVIAQIKNTPGILFDKDPIDEVKKLLTTGRMDTAQAAAQLGMSVDDLKNGFVQSKIPQLSGAYIRPADEMALTQFLTHEPKQTLYDKALGKWKEYSLMNSLVHGHNIAYNGMYLGGANPEYIAEHLGNIVKGNSDPWVERAIRSGSVSQDGASFAKELKNASGQTNPFLKAFDFARHGALWDTDKAMRTSIFRQGVENGMSDAEAAARANKFMGNYNNLTPFEQKVMTRVFPFYNWMKSNLPLQAEQWINNPMKQNLPGILKNSVSEDLSGQPTKDGKIDTGQVLPDGSHVMIDPYLPVDETAKMLRDGPLAFLYGKINPIAKELIDQVTNHAYYPGSTLAPNGKESMGTVPIRIQGAPESYNIAKSLAHAANQINPFGGSAIGNAIDSKNLVNSFMGLPTKNQPEYTPTEIATKLLGGFASRDNPSKDAVNQQYDQQNNEKGYIQYLRQTGQPVPKALQKQAYRKIPKAN